MRKIITTLCNGVTNTRSFSAEESYDAFHAAIGVMVGDLAAQNEGLDGINVRMSNGDGPLDLGVATFYYEAQTNHNTSFGPDRKNLAEINLVAE